MTLQVETVISAETFQNPRMHDSMADRAQLMSFKHTLRSLNPGTAMSADTLSIALADSLAAGV